MTADDTIRSFALAGADSVYAYIERTAEPVPGGVRWLTKSYQNKPQYSAELFDGVAGISLFLSDYARLRNATSAAELARAALEWCSEPAQLNEDRSLFVGRAGLGMAWLRLAEATGDSSFLSRATTSAEFVLAAPPGPTTDVIGGAAGEGIFLIRLWHATRDERFLSGSVRNAEWLEAQAISNDAGCHWPMMVGGQPERNFLGYSHGVAGIGYFLLLVYEATGDRRWAEMSRRALSTLSSQAVPDHGGLNWPPGLGQKELTRCQWCHGAPGVGLIFVKAAEALEEPLHLETAKAAGEATFAYGDVRRNPSQCHGLSGNAELFVELYHATGDRLWLERAHSFANLAFAYRHVTVDGDSWQSDVAGMSSQDFMSGAAGVGAFFLRLGAVERLRAPLV